MGRSRKPYKDDILNFIRSFYAEQKDSPTVREICNAVGVPSTATAKDYCDQLRAEGLVHFEAGKQRTIRPVYPEGNADES